ncbi:MAG: gamma-glutamyltransferase, partial [Candidatus Sulfotelmatobacter sp.]
MKPRRMTALRPSAALLVFLSISFTLCAQDRSYGRSVVATQYGMVATSQVAASQAGALILERGGSAIDAAITANAVLNVTEPNSNGMGGDLFAIYWEAKTGKLYGLNASGWAPESLTIEHLHKKDIAAMPQFGIDSVTVPGVVDGWAKLYDRWGKLPWRDLFQPAIFYADHGFPVAEIIHAWWDGDHDGLLTNTESQRVFLPGGKVPETGEIFRNPDVARALTLVANQGETVFYRGEIAKAILKTSDELGGTMAADDLASYSAECVEPISTKYRDWTVYELPPNGDGIA